MAGESVAVEVEVNLHGGVALDGTLTMPADARGVVAFAHGSGSSRHSPRNKAVAAALNDAGLATLLADLLTLQEERIDAGTRALRFDVGLLATRVGALVTWLSWQPATRSLPLGLFGASTGAAAALLAAASAPDRVAAVVSRGGRPDLAGEALTTVRSPTLFIVGSEDTDVVALNQAAMQHMTAPCRMEVVPGASHLFEEPGALEAVTGLATGWFARQFEVAAPGGGSSTHV